MLDMIHSLVVSTETLYQHPTVSAKGKCIKVRFTRAPFKPLSDQERIRYPSFSLTKNDCLKLWFLSKKRLADFSWRNKLFGFKRFQNKKFSVIAYYHHSKSGARYHFLIITCENFSVCLIKFRTKLRVIVNIRREVRE